MNEQLLLERITISPDILDCQPAVRSRLPVAQVLAHLATGETWETMMQSHPWLEPEDIQACLLYARQLVTQEQANLIHRQPKTLDDLIAKIPSILQEVPYLTLLVLFGSRARGDHDVKSDWDFAFLCDEQMHKQYETGGWSTLRVLGVLQEIYRLGDDQIDVVDIKECSALLAHSIARDGKVIYEQNHGAFVDFQQEKLMTPEAIKYLRREMSDRLKQTIQELRKWPLTFLLFNSSLTWLPVI